MDKSIRNMVIGLLILVVLVPLGLIATGETFGEWGNEEIEEKLGYVPRGLEELSSFWQRAPLPDYAFEGDESTGGAVIAYVLSAIIGVVLGGGLLYFAGKRIAKD
ncbi:PDGLE domain-containing protein [Methanotrichaceae archaeon M04Ac]|uniref:PDGLE domain-containing protein n=1 Tax=Candidatus Methanocrinis alkalitolerans TaxID=3033395 RepID=A0ABT5XGE6_9EURY|nr:PDGLE domain-containing protein [Candidatus Methanocrinis alkalitolerans]MDF0593562.1 PDGLE domain-containing protein [Candidatus Methanocrinis alkalitolerans]